MKLKPETVGFVRGGMLVLEPPQRWRIWQRDIWSCCCGRGVIPIVRAVYCCASCGIPMTHATADGREDGPCVRSLPRGDDRRRLNNPPP